MKSFLLPTGINKTIDKYIKILLWEHESNTKKIHTLKWDEIAKTKKLGGIGITQMSHQNKALFLNTLWKIKNTQQNKCASVYLSKTVLIFVKKKNLYFFH